MDWKTRVAGILLWTFLVLSSIGDGKAEERVVCYYTNWSVYRPGTAKFSPQNINPYLCTHLIYAFGGFTKDNALKPFDKYQDIEKGGYAKFTGLKTYNKDLKTMLAIGGWNEGSSRFSPMVADPDRRKQFVKNAIKFLRQNHFDGLDLDWEYPAFRDGGKPRDKNNYADLVQELREEFERESSKSGRPRLLLSMAVPAGIEYINKGYDIPRLNEYLDFINLLSYDYHSAYEPSANHHSPLYPLEEDNEYNYDSELTIDYTIKHLLTSGASPEKIVLGIPTYGRSYTLFNAEATEIGAPADGPGEEGDATREKGYLAYYEICESVGKSDEWQVVQPNPNAMGPYAYRGNQWVGYDDEDIVRAKARYAKENKLGGIMFWSIDNDDFRGNCHGRPYPLIEAAKEALLSTDQKSDSRTRTRPPETRKKTKTRQKSQSGSSGRKFNAGRRTSTESTRPRILSTSKSNARSNQSSDEDDENDEEERVNSVKSLEKPRSRTRAGFRNRSNAASRKKTSNSRRNNDREKTAEESPVNKLTTPEPPTTPDPGTDFKCEDEGFFPHPRDCKKYFWCLDSGPSGLGVVAHQFTCPSGLVFNKAADSCDYPRNVICPKAKTSEKPAKTTTTTTSSTTAKSSPKTTTEDSAEYEYYDEEDAEEEEEEGSLEDSRSTEEPRTTTPKTYKTISRGRATSTEAASSTTISTTKSYETTIEKGTSLEEEQDPKVIKELIDLIKKAGGIEQLEKQLLSQEKNEEDSGKKEKGKSTPATISRSLYERVLNRQATRIAGGFLGSLSTTEKNLRAQEEKTSSKNSRSGGFVNGPGGAQFEGLEKVPEVKSLRRTNKHQYVTIERQRSSTKASLNEDEEEQRDEEESSEAVGEEREKHSHRESNDKRIVPNYVNIRRTSPSTTTSENDVDLKEEKEDEEDEDEEEEEQVIEKEERTSNAKSRYTNINRFRSTSLRTQEEDSSRSDSTTPETEPTLSEPEIVSSTARTLETLPETTESPVTVETTESGLKLVENSATEILLTTLPASSSLEPRGTTLSAVSQPRPFGFSRRERTTTTTTTPTPTITTRTRTRTTTTTTTTTPRSVSEEAGSKVNSTRLKLPTLKEIVYPRIPSGVEESSAVRADGSLGSEEAKREFELHGQIADNEILPSEEIESSLGKQSIRRVELPVRILIDSEGEDREEEAELVLLRIPENRLDSAILKPVFRVKLVPGARNSTEQRSTSAPTTRKRQRIVKARRRTGIPTSTALPRETIPETRRAFYVTKNIPGLDSSQGNDSWRKEILGTTISNEFTTTTTLFQDYSETTTVRTISRRLDDEETSSLPPIESTTFEETGTSLPGDPTTDEGSRTTFPSFNSMETHRFTTEESLEGSNPTTVRTTPSFDLDQEALSSEPAPTGSSAGSEIFEGTTVPITTISRFRNFSENPVREPGTTETRPQLVTYTQETRFSTTPGTESTTGTSFPSTLSRDESTDFPSTLLTDMPTATTTSDDLAGTVTWLENDQESSSSRTNDGENLETTTSSLRTTNLDTIDASTTSDYQTVTEFFEDLGAKSEERVTLRTTTFTITTENDRDDESEENSRTTLENLSSSRIKGLEAVRESTTGKIESEGNSRTTLGNISSSRKKVSEEARETTTRKIDESSENPRLAVKSRSHARKRIPEARGTTESSQLDESKENSVPTPETRFYSRKRITEVRATTKTSQIDERKENSVPNPESRFYSRKRIAEARATTESSQFDESKENSVPTPESRFHSRKRIVETKATTETSRNDKSKENSLSTFENRSPSRKRVPETKVTTEKSLIDEIKVNSVSTPESRLNSARKRISETRVTTETSELNDSEENSVSIPEIPSSPEKTIPEPKATTEASRIDESEENSNSTSESSSPSKVNISGEERATTIPPRTSRTDSTERDSISTTESGPSSSNEGVPEESRATSPMPTRSKISRGRLRFSNSAGAENGRPVKQLVVRRRPAKDPGSSNEVERSNGASSLAQGSPEPTRRRVVVYRSRGRPEASSTTTVTTTTTRIPEVEVIAREESGGRTRGKWRKRLVLKRSRGDTARPDDQSIAESEHVGRALDEDSAEVSPLKKNLGLQRPLFARPNFKGALRTPSSVRSHDPTYEIRADDQSTRAQELAPALLHPATSSPTTTTESGRAGLRKPARKISTTMAPRTTSASAPRRGTKRGSIGSLEVTSARPARRPPILDYDYYVDDEIRIVLKPELKDKLFITRKGAVRCLDQGNFPHPTACNKFITCARMVNGQVLGTEYTCPDKLSFDPVGGICNWSAGLGCHQN